MAALLLGGGEARAQMEVERWSADLTPVGGPQVVPGGENTLDGESVYGYAGSVSVQPGGMLSPSTFDYSNVTYTVDRLWVSSSIDSVVFATSPGLPDDAGLMLRLPTFRTSAGGGCSVGGDEDFDLKPSSASSFIEGRFVWRFPSNGCLTVDTWAAAVGTTGTVKLVEIVQPAVESVIVANAPQSGDTYRLYETILFTVTFSQPVRVTPGRLRLKVGLDNSGGASGSTVEAVFSGQSKSERPTADTPRVSVSRHLHFEYKVQLFDRDVDGVRIGANALRLASEVRIRNQVGDDDAELDHAAFGPLSDHKVDAGGTAAGLPVIERIEVVSTPRLSSKGTTNRDTYGEGENIRIEVRFDQPVVVEGEPTFALEVGNPCLAVCEAYYESGSGTNTLVFAYLVLEVDIDRNGIAIRGNPIEVVSGDGDSIRNAADQEAHLSSKGKGTQRGHKVDGSRAAGSHLSVEDAEAHEADGEMEFTVRLEPHGLGIVRVDYATDHARGAVD